MKKVLLSTLALVGLATTLMSVQGGSAAGQPGDRTGRAAANNTCRGCHSGSTYGAVTVTQDVKDAGGNVVTAYVPGQTYTRSR
jgi:cytochrome c5